jgi:HAD superfamily hydrolase (TIGR01509 family)
MLRFVESASLPWPPAPVSAVLFDLDGTITRPVLDFEAIRREIGVEGFILEAIARLDGAGQRRALALLERHEREAADRSELNDGIGELLGLLAAAGCKVAVVTRNSHASVDIVAARHSLQFDAVVTRNEAAIKPSPEPLLLGCRRVGVAPAEALWVGDGTLDRQSGLAAGIRTVMIRSRADEDGAGVLLVGSPRELARMLRPGM